MESDVNFSWTLLKKEFKPVLVGMGVFLLLLFFEKASFHLSVISTVFYFFLLIITIFDIRYGLIFNKILFCFLVVFFIIYPLQYTFFPPIFPPISEGILTAFLAAIIFIFIQIISKNGMGGGDIKFIFCLGFWLGFEKILMAFYIAIFSALIAVIFYKKFRQKGALIPFGAFLSFGAIIAFLYGEKLLNLYEEFLF